MGPASLALLVVGIALVAVGYVRAKPIWQRYQALKAQDANIARYEAWRGGVRDDSKTGASVAMELLRRQVRIWGGVAIAGGVLVFVAFFIR